MKKKIVFVFNAIVNRCIKRVEEFMDHGYEVEAYAFSRGEEAYAQSKMFPIRIIGKHDLSMGYIERAIIIKNSMRELFKKYRHDDIIYYFFFFDVASIGHFFCHKPYIYEESDIPYTRISNPIVLSFMARLDRRIIRKSILTTMTSEGFVEYHFGENKPDNILVVPNRVNERLNQLAYNEVPTDIEHINFSFIGGFRYLSTLNFFKYGAKHFPQHTFSIYGKIMAYKNEIEELAANYDNILIHGSFKNPDDLPAIYGETDLVLANYDASSINARYAEPNKMYESIYFHTPIVVSSGTYIARKVAGLGIGYDLDSNCEKDVIDFISSLTEESIHERKKSAALLPKSFSVNINLELFKYLDNLKI